MPQGKAGFTLLELLAAMAILAVVMGFMGVSFWNTIRQKELTNDVMALTYVLEQARGASVKTSVDQVVSVSTTGGNVVLTYGTKTALVSSASFCVSGTCNTTLQITYMAPHGEMCWRVAGGACNLTDTALDFTRNSNSATLVMQGVYGYASIRDVN